ncbi:MAG: hypothetical protein HYW07_16995 [Candidatus Latescibacteria bacterium]|nr:hypothetical protein [Candidatus Latescibacterota bacterium]
MFADLLPVLALAGTALLIPFVVLVATKKRERYCGDKLKHCFWCGEQCTYYQLQEEPGKRSA